MKIDWKKAIGLTFRYAMLETHGVQLRKQRLLGLFGHQSHHARRVGSHRRSGQGLQLAG